MLWPRSFDGLIWVVQKIIKNMSWNNTPVLMFLSPKGVNLLMLNIAQPALSPSNVSCIAAGGDKMQRQGGHWMAARNWPPLEMLLPGTEETCFFGGSLAWNLTVCCLYLTMVCTACWKTACRLCRTCTKTSSTLSKNCSKSTLTERRPLGCLWCTRHVSWSFMVLSW